jgi:hypothetical protein
MSARRVVTADGADGRSYVSLEGPVAYKTVLDDYPGVEVEHVWSTRDCGLLDSTAGEGTTPADGLYPPPGGTRFLRITYPSGFGASASDAAASRFARLLMHRSMTVDYGVIVAGELTLVLKDGSQTTLRAGDLVVQRGVRHGWRKLGAVPALAIFVLVGFER